MGIQYRNCHSGSGQERPTSGYLQHFSQWHHLGMSLHGANNCEIKLLGRIKQQGLEKGFWLASVRIRLSWALFWSPLFLEALI